MSHELPRVAQLPSEFAPRNIDTMLLDAPLCIASENILYNPGDFGVYIDGRTCDTRETKPDTRVYVARVFAGAYFGLIADMRNLTPSAKHGFYQTAPEEFEGDDLHRWEWIEDKNAERPVAAIATVDPQSGDVRYSGDERFFDALDWLCDSIDNENRPINIERPEDRHEQYEMSRASKRLTRVQMFGMRIAGYATFFNNLF